MAAAMSVTCMAYCIARSRRQRYSRAKQHWEGLYCTDQISARQLQAGYDAALAITAHADSVAWRRRGQTLELSSDMWYEEVG
jgi:hypothetical protein